jgi:lipoprotein-releasing system permease protein
LYNAFIIIVLGLIFGNGLGLLFCYLQDTFGFITLDESSYYFTTAPVGFPWLQILLINVITIAVNLLVLLIPSAIISRISPVKAIRFD